MCVQSTYTCTNTHVYRVSWNYVNIPAYEMNGENIARLRNAKDDKVDAVSRNVALGIRDDDAARIRGRAVQRSDKKRERERMGVITLARTLERMETWRGCSKEIV